MTATQAVTPAGPMARYEKSVIDRSPISRIGLGSFEGSGLSRGRALASGVLALWASRGSEAFPASGGLGR